MNQSSQGTKAPKAHDAVPVFCEHPLKILNAKTIKFWYSERQLVSQEYPTEPLDKIPARQAEFELAGKKKHWLVSWLGNLNERLASYS